MFSQALIGLNLNTNTQGRLPFDESALRKLLTAIKSGKYTMPDVEPDIQDLIRKMLTVDPQKRITLCEIKVHPAFLKGLPSTYKCPEPLPIPLMPKPVDMSSVSPIFLDTLRQIGYDDQRQLEKDLLSCDNTPAKELIYLMERNISFDTLPWASLPETGNRTYDSFYLPAEAPMAGSGIFAKHDPFYRTVHNSDFSFMNSPAAYSAIESSILQSIPDTIDLEKKEILGIRVSLSFLMASVQGFLFENGWKWFHPDEFTILARNTLVSADMSIEAVFQPDQSITLVSKFVSGSSEHFDNFTGILSVFIENLV